MVQYKSNDGKILIDLLPKDSKILMTISNKVPFEGSKELSFTFEDFVEYMSMCSDFLIIQYNDYRGYPHDKHKVAKISLNYITTRDMIDELAQRSIDKESELDYITESQIKVSIGKITKG